jgi:hypothetical protein
MAKNPRRKLFVDWQVQGALLLRTVMYWIFALLTVTLMLMIWRILNGGLTSGGSGLLVEMWHHYAPVFVSTFLLLPIVVIDTVRLSNRFAGPMVRLRRGLRQLAQGETVQPIHFREQDFWREVAADFNTVAAELQQSRTAETAQL